MDHPVCVDVVKGLEEHPHGAPNFLFTEQGFASAGRVLNHLRLPFVDHTLKVGCVAHLLHHDVKIVLIFEGFSVSHDVGVVKLRQDLDFLVDCCKDLWIHVFSEKDLYCVA